MSQVEDPGEMCGGCSERPVLLLADSAAASVLAENGEMKIGYEERSTALRLRHRGKTCVDEGCALQV